MWYNVSCQENDWSIYGDWSMYGDLSMYGDWSGEYLEDGRQVVWMGYHGYWWS